jgi:predicted AlkP superfamily pyrophosphatase or phosphodiesterase
LTRNAFLRCLLAPLLLSLISNAQPAPKRPSLILAITIDQFRYDYLARFRDQYRGGLARLLNQGAVFTNAYCNHFPTVTAIGHSTYLSGATPSVSGIIGNSWYDRQSGKSVTSVSDGTVKMLGGSGRGAGADAASPRRMLVSTLGDELKMAGRNSKVIGISVKDRSAILPAGHMADGAYWFDPSSGNFVSSTYYFKGLPVWVNEFNKSRHADRFLGAEWKPLEGGAPYKKLRSTPDTAFYTSLEGSPHGNELVAAFAKAALLGEGLGKRNTTDLLAVSFSANDYIGHDLGPDAPQVRDVSIRTDQLLGEFFAFLETHAGMKNVLVVLTADHGVAPLPEVNQQRRMPGGRVLEKSISARVEERLKARYGDGQWIAGRTGASFYLNEKLIQEKRLNAAEVAEVAAAAARSVPNVFRSYTREQLARGAVPGDAIDRRVLNGFFYQRAADVTVIAEPYYLFEAKGASHGMPFGYDSHIPIIFMGERIRPGRYHAGVRPNDIAPTLATLLDVETPSGSVGRALHEIFAPEKPQATAPPAKRAPGASRP